MVARNEKHTIERVQTGVRMEKRLLKVLRAFADYNDLTLGDLMEGIVLHVFDGKCPFSESSLGRIRELKKFYGLDLDSSHLVEHRAAPASHDDLISEFRELERESQADAGGGPGNENGPIVEIHKIPFVSTLVETALFLAFTGPFFNSV